MVSITETIASQVAVFPEASDIVNVTVFSPISSQENVSILTSKETIPSLSVDPPSKKFALIVA